MQVSNRNRHAAAIARSLVVKTVHRASYYKFFILCCAVSLLLQRTTDASGSSLGCQSKHFWASLANLAEHRFVAIDTRQKLWCDAIVRFATIVQQSKHAICALIVCK